MKKIECQQGLSKIYILYLFGIVWFTIFVEYDIFGVPVLCVSIRETKECHMKQVHIT